jgi:hypothetical protein
MSELFRVMTGEGKSAVTLMEAPEKDARKYVEDHFPRIHIQPGVNTPPSPDAYLRGPDDTEEHFHGPENGWKTPEDTANLASHGQVQASDAEEFQKFLAWRQEQKRVEAAKAAKDAADLAAWQADRENAATIAKNEGVEGTD